MLHQDYSQQLEFVLIALWWLFVVCRMSFVPKPQQVVQSTVKPVVNVVDEPILEPVINSPTVGYEYTALLSVVEEVQEVVVQVAEAEDLGLVEETWDEQSYAEALDGLMALTIRELKELAKQRTNSEAPIKGYSRMTKLQLAKALLA
jgi:hypothetical protein